MTGLHVELYPIQSASQRDCTPKSGRHSANPARSVRCPLLRAMLESRRTINEAAPKDSPEAFDAQAPLIRARHNLTRRAECLLLRIFI